MEVLEYLFSSFWTWLGFAAVICLIGYYLVEIIKAIRGSRRRITVHYYEEPRIRVVEINGASDSDRDKALNGWEELTNEQEK